jgi:hypothetical protein
MKSSISDVYTDTEDRTEQTQHAGSSIRSFLDACGYTEKLTEHRALVIWESVIEESLGKDASKATKATEIRNGQLQVVVSKAAWRHRLAFETPHLIQMLNTRLGSETVLSIRLG